MEDITKIMSHVCPNICKECRPQCQKWQEISNLEGHELMKFIKTQREITGNDTERPPRKTDFTGKDVTSSAEPSPSQRQESISLDHKMTPCCIKCDTILQQISILLGEIWDILEPQPKICNVCRLAKYGKCNCQETGTYSLQSDSPRVNLPATKEGFLSWLTKLRHILLKVLEGVTRSRCKIYKGEPNDELERLLQELRLPLQRQARDIRITSLTKLHLSSTERDESLVASLIENTELLERVLAKIKSEGRKIEMKIFEDQRFGAQGKSARLPELKVISAQPFPSTTSSFASDYTMFPPILGKETSGREELKSGLSRAQDDTGEEYKRASSKRMDHARSPYDKSLIKSPVDIVSKEKTDYVGTVRKKDGSQHIPSKLPSDHSQHKEKEMNIRSAVTQDRRNIYSENKSKSLLSPTEKSTRKSLKLSVSFPGMSKNKITKGTKEHDKVKTSRITDRSIEELQKARVRASEQHLSINDRGKMRMKPETSREDQLQSKSRNKDVDDKKSSPGKSSVIEKRMKNRERSDELISGDKSTDKTKSEKDIKSTQIKSKVREETSKIKGKRKDEEDLESRQSKLTSDGISSAARDKKDTIRRFKTLGKFKDKKVNSMSVLENVKIKKGSKNKPKIIEWSSIDKRGDAEEVNKSKNKLKKEFSKGEIMKGKMMKGKIEPLPQDRETYTRRQTIQIPSKLILKKMNDLRVEELRRQKRLERKLIEKPIKKIKSLKSLPNLELLREKQRQRKTKKTITEISESNITECPSTPVPLEMIRGIRVVPFEPLPNQEYGGEPESLLFNVQADLADETSVIKNNAHSVSAVTFGSQRSLAGKGVIKYELSNPKYIELGYTKLPTVTVMRKSIVYKMEQPHPEEDWFRRHKQDRMLFYDTCEKLAEIDGDGHGRWYYKNGRMALNYCATEDRDARNRYIIYSSGENDASGNWRCDTILASFDHLGNGIVYDHCGNVRLKYNQNEGENFDKTIGPVGRWKWHSLNTTLSALQNVYVEQRVKIPNKSELDMFAEIANVGKKTSDHFEETAEEVVEEQKNMLIIEMSNFFKEKKQMLLQKYQPFQLKMKVLKLNEQFSLRIYEQRKIYLYFSVGTRTLKLNLGLLILPTEILGTDTMNLQGIMTPFDRVIPQSDSVANILDIVSETRKKMKRKKSFHHKFYSGIRNTSSPRKVIR